MSAVQRYRRHAQLYGCDDVYDVAAADGLEPIELGQLALALRTVDPKWRLSRCQAMDLAVALVRAGCPDKKIRELARISQPTVREAHCRAAESESFGQPDPIGLAA
jgi:hypothetical protein